MIPEATVERVYRVFAACPPNPSMDACPCCVYEETRARLPRIPLRELTCDELGPYAMKAMTTWGDAQDYKHFLPRILQLAATDEGQGWSSFEPELIADKLELAGWKTWSLQERAAVLDWFEALRHGVASADPDATPWSLDEVVAEISRLT